MRKINAVLSVLILILFLAHAIIGSFELIGAIGVVMKQISRAALVLVVFHVVIGIKFTVDSIIAMKKAGVGYFSANKMFWARRISGFAVMFLLAFHFTAFGIGNRVIPAISAVQLITQILLVAAVATHVITNVKPVLISFGIKGLKRRAPEIIIAVSAVIIFAVAALIIFYVTGMLA